MGRRIYITERQFERLVSHINENSHQLMVDKIVGELEANYEPIIDVYEDGGEFFERGMVLRKLDDETISPKSLKNYLQYKYKLNDGFIKQVIDDWYRGNLKDNNMLSKNVTI